MSDLNSVNISGRLTADPKLTYTGKGTAVCEARLVINRSFVDQASGERKDDPTYVDLQFWAKTAEFAAERLKKGERIAVNGSLRYDQWTTADGQTRSRIRVTVNELILLTAAPARSGQAPANAGQDDDIPY